MNKKEPRGLVGGVFQDAFILPRVERASQVESVKNISTVQYSKIIKQNNSIVQYSYDSDKVIRLLEDLSDVVPNDGYYPFYSSHVRRLGTARFVELANKARAASDTPARLFCWMLKNDGMVK